MQVSLKSIDIHAFRGIVDLQIPLDGKYLLLCGENGTGKSSVVDGIEFFFTGTISHLDGVQGISPTRHGPHVNFNSKDTEVKLTFNPGDICLSRTFDTVPIPSAVLQDYFDTAANAKFILRRTQILTFISAEPAKRFNQIATIIGVDKLDGIELEMMRAQDGLKGQADARLREIEACLVTISGILGQSVSKPSEVLSILNQKLTSLDAPAILGLDDLTTYSEKFFKVILQQVPELQKSTAIKKTISSLKNSLLTQNFRTQITSLQTQLTAFLGKESKAKLRLMSFLSGAKELMSEDIIIEKCPLCGQPIKKEDVLSQIEARLRTIESLSQEASQIRIDSSRIAEQVALAKQRVQNEINNTADLKEFEDERQTLGNVVTLFDHLMEKITLIQEMQNESALGGMQIYVMKINQGINKVVKKLEVIDSKTEMLSFKDSNALDTLRLIEQISTQSTYYLSLCGSLAVIQRHYQLATKIYSTFSETKKSIIQQVYSTIESDVRKFYSVLHPSEEVENIELVLSMHRRASTTLRIGMFGREGEDPRALASEGHLDSLGLCIFLAFVRKFNQSCSLIILDDVVTSIDSRHRQNICKLLLDEFKDNQFMIMTHDRMWFEQLCAAQRAYNVTNDFVNWEIKSWSKERGPVISEYKPTWDRIQEKIESSDREGAGNEGRNYLEWVLESLCQNTQTQIVFKGLDARYDVGDLFDPLKNKLTRIVLDDGIRARIAECFKELQMTIMLGNLMSHNNLLNNVTSINEVQRFCEAVKALENCLSCEKCSTLLVYFSELNELRCSNDRCKIPTIIKTKAK